MWNMVHQRLDVLNSCLMNRAELDYNQLFVASIYNYKYPLKPVLRHLHVLSFNKLKRIN